MGKNLISQKRGKGSPTYRTPSFRFKGSVTYSRDSDVLKHGIIKDLVHCQGHSAPLMEISYSDKEVVLMPAPEGVLVGQSVSSGPESEAKNGNVMILKDVPEGTPVYNIEGKPGDGGKFVKSSGTAAKIVTKTADKVIVVLPSRKKKTFPEMCRATIGIIAGGGRKDKPFLKAGSKHYAMKAKNKLYPKVSGLSMNAVDHPFGGGGSHTKGRPLQAGRNAPPGRKVGMVAPRRTGRK